MLTHTLCFSSNISHIFFHTIEVVECIREEFEVTLYVFHKVTLNCLQMLGKRFIHVLYMGLRSYLEDAGWQAEGL